MCPPHERPTPVGDSPPYFVRRILLDVMDSGDRHLRLRWQTAGEVDIPANGEYPAGLGLQDSLGTVLTLSHSS